MPFRLAVAAVALATVLAPSRVPAQSSGCSGKISGVVQGSFGCAVSVTAGKGGRVTVAFTRSGELAGVEALAPGSFELPGPPSSGTFTLDSMTAARASLRVLGKGTYEAGIAQGRRQGMVTLQIDTLERERSGGFVAGGSLRVVLVRSTGEAGEVVVEATF